MVVHNITPSLKTDPGVLRLLHSTVSNIKTVVTPIGFFTTHKISNICIITNFTIYLQFPSLFVSECCYQRTIFQDCTLHWSSSVLTVQAKRNWQYWHSCTAECLRKILLYTSKCDPLPPYLQELHMCVLFCLLYAHPVFQVQTRCRVWR